MAYTVALPVGAIATAGALYLAGRFVGGLPFPIVGIVAITGAASSSTLIPVRLPESRWRVPRTWDHFGHTLYAAVFGGVLGLGVLTALPSAGFYTLAAWGLAVGQWQYVWPVFGIFGVVRALVSLLIILRAHQHREYPAELLERVSALTGLVFPAEIVLLTVVGLLLLLSGGQP